MDDEIKITISTPTDQNNVPERKEYEIFFLFEPYILLRQSENNKKLKLIPSSYNDSYKDEICCICSEYFKHGHILTKTNCGHLFHLKCLKKWGEYKKFTCPVCRNQLPTTINHDRNNL